MKKASWRKIFFTIWSGQVVSLLTSSIVQYAIIWNLTAETKSAFILSIAGLVGILPTALFSPFIGGFIDKFDRKKIMIFADLGIAVVTIGLAITGLIVGHLPLPLVFVALFFRALGSAVHQPCLQAVTPQIVPSEELAKCSGYTQTFQSISFIASPALAAVLIAVLPLPLVIALDVIGAAAGILTLLPCKIPPVPKHPDQNEFHFLRDAKEGVVVLKKSRGIFWMMIVSFFANLMIMPAANLWPLACMDYFGGTEIHAGIAEMSFSIGMLVGGVVLGIWGGTKKKIVTIVMAEIMIGVFFILSGLVPPTAFPFFVATTFTMALFLPFVNLSMVYMQEKFPARYMGRVMGVAFSLSSLASAVGLIFSGAFAEIIGVMNWFILAGILCVVCGILCYFIRPVWNIDKEKPLFDEEATEAVSAEVE